MTGELPRPTPETLATRLVIYNESETVNCQFCGDVITSCGYDCQFSEWVHTVGRRAGSHKCGPKYGSRDASP